MVFFFILIINPQTATIFNDINELPINLALILIIGKLCLLCELLGNRACLCPVLAYSIGNSRETELFEQNRFA